MKKRNFITGASSFIFTGLYPVVSMAESASTYFSLIWRGLDVGFSNIKLKRSGKKITANIEVKISVKVLNFDAFSYNLKNEEISEMINKNKKIIENNDKIDLLFNLKNNLENLYYQSSCSDFRRFTVRINSNPFKIP